MIPSSLCLLLLLSVWPLSGDDPLEQTFPVEASGNIPFQADVVMFEEDGRIAPEVSIAIPRDALRGDDESDSLRIEVSVEMLDRRGESRVRYETAFTMAPNAALGRNSTFPVPERWLRLHPRWFDGTAGLRIQVEDVTRLKAGLLDKLRGEHPTGEAAAALPWPALRDSTGFVTSGLLFAWSQAEGAEKNGPGLRGVRARLQPNPFHYYGLFQPVVTVYWERYGVPPGAAESDPLEIVHEITRVADGAIVVRKEEPFTASPGARWELQRFDISRLSSGAYELEARIEDGADHVLASTEGRFQVVWEERRWIESEERLLEYARLLLSAEEYDSLLTLDRGGQEDFLRRFWNRRSPTSPGDTNALEAEFFRRVAYADKEFGTKLREGFRTDRGRVFVRLGPPDEISFNLNPQDRETLAYVLPEEIDDPSEDLEARLRQTRRRSVRDNSAYEVWEYTLQGDPLIPEYTGMQKGLKFVFVDELGYGEYTLVYTNVPGSLR